MLQTLLRWLGGPGRRRREAALARWDVKALGTALAQQLYAAGQAGPAVAMPEAPVPAGLTSRVCRQADLESDWLRHWCRRLHAYPVYHRKLWEDCFALQAMWEGGMLVPGRRALGFAVGREWLPSLLAAHGVEVVATDLDAADDRAQVWSRTGQHETAADGLYQPHLLDRAAFDGLVTHRAVDMRRIPADLHGGFDLVWSVCAFEHLGTLERGLDFVVEAMRCLRPGGLAVHTTEYNLGDAGTVRRGNTVLYQRRHLDALAARLAASGHTMLPLDAAVGEGVLDRFVDLPPYAHQPHPLNPLHAPHLRLSVHGWPVTSAGLIIRAGGPTETPAP